jgi:hypothetical protein
VAVPVVAALVLLTSSPLTGSLILWTALFAVLALVVVEFFAAAGTAPASSPDDGEPVEVDQTAGAPAASGS